MNNNNNKKIEFKHSWWEYLLNPATILGADFIEGYINAPDTVMVQAWDKNGQIVEREAAWYEKAGIFGAVNTTKEVSKALKNTVDKTQEL